MSIGVPVAVMSNFDNTLTKLVKGSMARLYELLVRSMDGKTIGKCQLISHI